MSVSSTVREHAFAEVNFKGFAIAKCSRFPWRGLGSVLACTRGSTDPPAHKQMSQKVAHGCS